MADLEQLRRSDVSATKREKLSGLAESFHTSTVTFRPRALLFAGARETEGEFSPRDGDAA